MSTTPRHQVFIDRGGTFTDCIGIHGRERTLRVVKLLSSDAAPIEAIRQLFDVPRGAPLPACDIRMGTTLATNALLERRGAKTALVVTEGFGDVLAIGDQTRPDLFALRIERPHAPVQAVLEIAARLDASGDVLRPLDREATLRALRRLRAQGIESLAVVVLHAYLDGQLEREVAALAHAAGFAHVSLSHEVVAEIGLCARAATTVLDAYVTPTLASYVQNLLTELPGSTLRVMQSSGGLVEARRFRGRHALLSGPAGGVVACAKIAAALGLPQVIGIDMGGTSTDVSRHSGSLEHVFEAEVAGMRIRAPSLRIHTVAAGGGSICRFDGQRLRVGPESAGAEPGPLCYGRSGAHALTLTDVNLALGRLHPQRFPFPLDRTRVDAALLQIAHRLDQAGTPRSPQAVAQGFFDVAVEHMAQAIRTVSVAEGHDVREHALVVFGGAGGQHACAVARRLGIRTLIFHPLAGVLSAFGMGVADEAFHGEADAGATRIEALADGRLPAALEAAFAAIEARGRELLIADGHAPAHLQAVRRIELRYTGTESTLTLPVAPTESLCERFTQLHSERYGYARPELGIEASTLRVEVVARATPIPVPLGSGRTAQVRAGSRVSEASLCIDGSAQAVPVYLREDLVPAHTLHGPALLLEATGTIVLEPGFTATLDAAGYLLVEDRLQPTAAPLQDTARDPVRLEIFANLVTSIAQQMGAVLQRTALSTNIRERMDFSCAVFDADGELIANAPHIPVHLGAMSESVRAVLKAHPNPQPGDVFATNDPFMGGSHLPDITVVTPIFDAAGKLALVAANRGHHADIGGITPGSMPPFSRALREEGAVFRALRIVSADRLDEAAILAVLQAGPHPARNPRQNLRDLEAQVAANQAGARLLADLVARFGWRATRAYMRHLLDDAQAKVEEALRALGDGVYRFEDAMDDGTPIAVTLTLCGARMHVDFSGTGAESDGNLNAPRAVTLAAVLYVLRALVGKPIPLNSGCLRPIELHIPERSLLSPSPGRAVVAGNVETSQRIVDVLLGALGKLAASQGTMNNLTFGDASFGYYETIAGGAGAGPDFDGASGVHTHMTNTRITDAEILERNFPVRLVRFALRHGSGGAGKHRGGDGVVREIEALVPLSFSILSERRLRAPFALAGGHPGALGRNLHGERELPGRASFEVAPGERVRIETPGGGGFGVGRSMRLDDAG